MKSERRHELEHNELADWTVNVVEAIKPYTNVIVGGTIAVLILAIGYSFWSQKSALESSTAWNMYYEALNSNNPAFLQEVIEMYPASKAAQWAAVCQGDMHLAAGCNGIFTDKASAKQELSQAVECYKAIETSQNPMLGERATFGLARAYETQGDLEEAKSAYKNQLNRWKNGPYSEMAKNRLADLERPSTLAFFDRFAKYEPKPDFSAADKPSSVIPSFESTDLPTPDEKTVEAKSTEVTPAEVTPTEETKTEEAKEEPLKEEEK